MTESWGERFGRHFLAPFMMLRDAGILSLLLVIIWFLYPFALQTVIHPSDAIGFQEWLQGLPISDYITHQAKMYGLASALFVLAFLCLTHFLVLLLIYRRIQYAVSIWLMAALLIGGIANGIWYLKTGHFDLQGALAGLSPVAVIIGCEMVFEKLGQDFMFGRGQRPSVV
jgi:hypothetical protein